jgi:hypothetical protein
MICYVNIRLGLRGNFEKVNHNLRFDQFIHVDEE